MKIALNVTIDDNGKMDANFNLEQTVAAEEQENYAKLLVDVIKTKMTLDSEEVQEKQVYDSILEGHKLFLDHSKQLQRTTGKPGEMNEVHTNFLKVMKSD